MIKRPAATQSPSAGRENESLELAATRPPLIPKCAQIAAGVGLEGREIRRSEEAGHAKEQRFDFLRRRAEQTQRKPLREEFESQLVLLVAEGGRELLKER